MTKKQPRPPETPDEMRLQRGAREAMTRLHMGKWDAKPSDGEMAEAATRDSGAILVTRPERWERITARLEPYLRLVVVAHLSDPVEIYGMILQQLDLAPFNAEHRAQICEAFAQVVELVTPMDLPRDEH